MSSWKSAVILNSWRARDNNETAVFTRVVWVLHSCHPMKPMELMLMLMPMLNTAKWSHESFARNLSLDVSRSQLDNCVAVILMTRRCASTSSCRPLVSAGFHSDRFWLVEGGDSVPFPLRFGCEQQGARWRGHSCLQWCLHGRSTALSCGPRF